MSTHLLTIRTLCSTIGFSHDFKDSWLYPQLFRNCIRFYPTSTVDNHFLTIVEISTVSHVKCYFLVIVIHSFFCLFSFDSEKVVKRGYLAFFTAFQAKAGKSFQFLPRPPDRRNKDPAGPVSAAKASGSSSSVSLLPPALQQQINPFAITAKLNYILFLHPFSSLH